MSNPVLYKTVSFKAFQLHFFYFKQANINTLEQVYDEVSELTYSNHIEIIHHQLFVPAAYKNTQNKLVKKVFGEVNWFNSVLCTQENEIVSGVFIGISACSFKTLLMGNNMFKLFDLSSNKAALVNATHKTDIQDANLMLTGLSRKDLVLDISRLDIYEGSLLLFSSAINPIHNNEYNNLKPIICKVDNEVYINVVDEGYNETHDFSSYIEESFSNLALLIEQNNVKWSALVYATFVVESAEQLKQIKLLLKELKVPMSGIFYHKPQKNSHSFKFEMNFIKGSEA